MAKLNKKQDISMDLGFEDFKISFLEGIVLASFFPKAGEMTIKELQKKCKYSYERVNSALKSLTKKKMIEQKEKGKTLVYSPIFGNPIMETIGFGNYMLQRKINFIKKHKILSKAINEMRSNPIIGILILFGSYSKGIESKNSDIDLMAATIPGKEKEAEDFIKSFAAKYGFNFSPAALSLPEFPKIKKENKDLWNDLKQYGIIFKGNEYFYLEAYENENN